MSCFTHFGAVSVTASGGSIRGIAVAVSIATGAVGVAVSAAESEISAAVGNAPTDSRVGAATGVGRVSVVGLDTSSAHPRTCSIRHRIESNFKATIAPIPITAASNKNHFHRDIAQHYNASRLRYNLLMIFK